MQGLLHLLDQTGIALAQMQAENQALREELARRDNTPAPAPAEETAP